MGKQKLCIVTDAWSPQINGVVTTLTNLVQQARDDGWEVLVIHPEMFVGISAPIYKEVKLCWTFGLKKKIKEFNPDHLHIATEGPLGLAARISFRREQYTTAYHTEWADFLNDLFGIPKTITWAFIRWFHSNGKVMVPTPSIRDELIKEKIKAEIVLFSRGVDLSYLTPTVKHKKNTVPRLLSVGRISIEKNLDAFCSLDHKKYDLVVVGDGPYLKKLKSKYPTVSFLGMLRGSDLANEYVKADCMVFTSVKDTFGLVIIESQSLGTPVAAFPVKGPKDVILPETGVIDDDIDLAITSALKLNRKKCSQIAKKTYNWKQVWTNFKNNLVKH
jgi:glycosyltransferase involved in cell wall biosynthesis